jgi:DNA-binding MarR family transcriptional regulator
MSADQVDHIIEQWNAHQTAHVDPAPLAVTGRILQIARHLERARLQLLAPWRLTLADFDVLATLARSRREEGVNPRSLLSETMVTSGAITTRLDRLEALGYIRRMPDPADRRGVLVQLTATGSEAASAAFAAVMAAEDVFVGRLPNAQRHSLQAALRTLGAAVDHRS